MSLIINPYAYAGGGGSDPLGIPDLELWLKMSTLSGLSNDDPITTWPDSSGNGRDATGTGLSGAKPVYKTSGGPTGGPSVRLSLDDGSALRFFSLPNFLTGFTAGEIFVICIAKADPGDGVNSSNGPPVGDWGSATAGSLYPFWSDSKIYEEFGTTVRKTTNDPTTSLAAWNCYNIRSAAGSFVWSINGATSGNDFFSTATNTVGWGTAPKIGADDVGKYLHGSEVEVIFFSRILDDATERKAVIHQHLNDEHGFSLPTS